MQPQGIKNSLKLRLESELRELGIAPTDVIEPYRTQVRPVGPNELDFAKNTQIPDVIEETLEGSIGISADRRRLVDSITGRPVAAPGAPLESHMSLADEGALTARPKNKDLSAMLDEQAIHDWSSGDLMNLGVDATAEQWMEALGCTRQQLFEVCEKYRISPVSELWKLRWFLR